MKEYIILVAVAAIVAAFADILSPKEWHGYVRVITGFLILAVLLSPVAKLKNIDIFNVEENFEVSDVSIKDRVKEELAKNVEKDISQRAREEFGVEVTASVEIEVNEEHKIKGVRHIVINGRKIPEGLVKRLKEVYGCDSIEFKSK